MGDVITAMAYFWGLMLLSYFLMQNGLWILNDVVKSMCRFALGKAIGPPIDFVEGRQGSASRTWIMQGMFWLVLASLFTFEGFGLNTTHTPSTAYPHGVTIQPQILFSMQLALLLFTVELGC